MIKLRLNENDNENRRISRSRVEKENYDNYDYGYSRYGCYGNDCGDYDDYDRVVANSYNDGNFVRRNSRIYRNKIKSCGICPKCGAELQCDGESDLIKYCPECDWRN